MAEGTGSLADVDDIHGTFGKSEFLDYLGTKLNMSVSASYKKFLVFWNEEDDESDSHQSLFSSLDPSPHPPPSICSSMVKERIKIALQHVDLSYYLSILAQFWTPVIIGGRLLLKTSDQPFGLTYLRKGLCSYRKLCLSYYYCCNNAPDGDIMIGGDKRESVLFTGPPSRVFLNGLPEYSPNLEFYSKTEYPLRDEAMCRKIKNYMAVPVFEPSSQQCLGVLELVSTAGLIGEMDKPAYIFGLISTALQGVELRTSNFTCHFDMEKDLAKSSTGVSHALRDIRKALDEACTKHQLPFAQTWIRRSGENQNYLNNVLSTSDEYYQSQTRFSILRDTCESFQLLRGRGVVWRAFSSSNSCFCIDVTQLSIAEYSFAHVARKVRLDSSFAICLKSDYTGDDDFYVLELFLPSMTAYPRSLLELVLLSMKKHLNSFRIASGQKLGNEMHVEVLRTSQDDKLDFFRLFPTTTGSSVGLQALQDQNSLMHLPFSNEQTHDLLEYGATENANIIVNMEHEHLESYNFDWIFDKDVSVSTSSLAVDDDVTPWKEDSSDTRSMKEGSSYNNSSASTCRFPDQDYLERLQAEDHDAMGLDTYLNHGLDYSDPKEGRSPAPEFDRFSREIVEKHFGLKLKDAARSLKVSSSTLKRKCRKLGIPSWPRKKNQTTCSTTSIESNQDTENHNAANGELTLHPNISAEEVTTCSNQHFSQAITMPSSSFISAEEGTTCSNQHFSQAITMPSSSFMTIKAAYGEKVKIRFRLPFSSRMIDMETEVAIRLKLCVGDFKIWYQDEDDDWILLTCDADMRTMESIGKSTIRASITHDTDTPTF